MDDTGKIDIFVSYAHEDDILRKELDIHLSELKQQQKIRIWHHQNIKLGTDWKRETEEQQNAADIILLLISPDFMASKSCYDEMLRAVARYERDKVRVIPIILRPVNWESAPFAKLVPQRN